MTFADLVNGTTLFVDANIFVYAFAPDAQFGVPCDDLLERIENRDLIGVSSTHVLSDVAHRLMSLEACTIFGWPYSGIAQRLHRHPEEIKKLSRFRRALEAIQAIGIQPLPVLSRHVLAAAAISQLHGMLSNDALILALMQEHGIVQIATYDADFDRVPGIQRFASP